MRKSELEILRDREVASGWLSRDVPWWKQDAQNLASNLDKALAERDALEAKVAELENWKREAQEVMPPFQEIGKQLGVRPGESVHDKILPGIVGLKNAVENCNAQLQLHGHVADLCAFSGTKLEGEAPEVWTLAECLRRLRDYCDILKDRVAILEAEANRRQELSKTAKIFALVEKELKAAMAAFPKFNSAHEGYAVILEELDELKSEVWRNQKSRDHYRMQREAVQVAAMAIRFLHDVEGLVRREGGES